MTSVAIRKEDQHELRARPVSKKGNNEIDTSDKASDSG